MAMLRVVAKTSGGGIGPGWNLVVLHHTDCKRKLKVGVTLVNGKSGAIGLSFVASASSTATPRNESIDGLFGKDKRISTRSANRRGRTAERPCFWPACQGNRSAWLAA
jgi:hypothetical protein